MGARGKKCPLCSDPQLRKRADASVAAGLSYAEIGASLSVSKFSVGRHARHSARLVALATPAPGDELTESEARLAQLAARAEASWLAAAATGNGKDALEVLKAQIRLAVDHHERLLEKHEKAAAETDDPSNPTAGAPSVAWIDRIVNESRAREAQALRNGKIRCPLCGCGLVSPEQIAPRKETNGDGDIITQ